MKTEILSWICWSIIGLLISGMWVAIIWAIGKYSPSPWWGLLCFPVFIAIPLWGRLEECVLKEKDPFEETY